MAQHLKGKQARKGNKGAKIGGDVTSRINVLINRRCLVSPLTLAKALGIPPQYLHKFMNSPIVYLSLNQMILLSFYLNLSLYELLSVIGSDQLALSFPPTFLEAVQNRNIKVNGDYIGNMLPIKDNKNNNWFD